MKLSLAVVALAASANAFNPGAGPAVDFKWDHFRIGHTGVARDVPEIDPRDAAPDAAPVDVHDVRDPSAVQARDPHFGHHGYHRYNAPIFVEAPGVPLPAQRKPCHGKLGLSISGILARLGFGQPTGVSVVPNFHSAAHRGEHNKHHGHYYPAPKKPEDGAEAPVAEAEFAHILPIFGEDAGHSAAVAELEAQAAGEKTEHKHKHKGDKKYKHKHHDHKHKHHDHKHKHDKHKEHSLKVAGHKLCDALKDLPPVLRGFVMGALVGSFLQVVFSLVYLAVRLRRRGSCESRRARRAARKEARKAAKAAYKANKAAKKSKAAEAGYTDEEEALPSYAEGETDALVVRQ